MSELGLTLEANVDWKELTGRFEEAKKRPWPVGVSPLITVTREEAEWIALQALEEIKKRDVPVVEAWMFGVFPKKEKGLADIDVRIRLRPHLSKEEIFEASRKCERLMLEWMEERGVLVPLTLYEEAGLPYEPYKRIYPPHGWELELAFTERVLGRFASMRLEAKEVTQTIRSDKEIEGIKVGDVVDISLDGLSVGKARVTSVDKVWLADLDKDDAQRGGFEGIVYELRKALARAGFRFKPLEEYEANRVVFSWL